MTYGACPAGGTVTAATALVTVAGGVNFGVAWLAAATGAAELDRTGAGATGGTTTADGVGELADATIGDASAFTGGLTAD